MRNDIINNPTGQAADSNPRRISPMRDFSTIVTRQDYQSIKSR
jgi:hypothetical protein